MSVLKSNTSNKITLGLRENWQQFALLVLVNAFVGGMIGMERSILPEFASVRFGLVSTSVMLTFILAFGISKAIANYYTGRLAQRLGRKKLLVVGWIIALPVPMLLLVAPTWNWVIAANILLGISQGLTWSAAVIMKIDLVGQKNRGFAMGINEFAGYFAVGLIAFLTGLVASNFGVHPYPFYLGIGISLLGLFFSVFFVKDTIQHMQAESSAPELSTQAIFPNIFLATTFSNKTLSTVTQAGLINNLNDGMIWGLLPVLLLQNQFSTADAAILTALYPTVWGLGQLFTGKLADVLAKKPLLVMGNAGARGGHHRHYHLDFLYRDRADGCGTWLGYRTGLSDILGHYSQRHTP
ncbi:major facilitator superfamily mfs_1 [Nitritalea halalkaliphila LW7]|uniref:Major facilitator superfamily mfs_1 n=1 Tax=Nitritalea halalkaliphila LW7 TaxID=1189621 RepID=I5C5H8_9BACT|nr:MFS transporter [Nitritalea halalkaliphila]EIM77080.1 major facilitator superfamily mfs_1 [Nitritalea halalkaliphila LW7]